MFEATSESLGHSDIFCTSRAILSPFVVFFGPFWCFWWVRDHWWKFWTFFSVLWSFWDFKVNFEQFSRLFLYLSYSGLFMVFDHVCGLFCKVSLKDDWTFGQMPVGPTQFLWLGKLNVRTILDFWKLTLFCLWSPFEVVTHFNSKGLI